MLSSGQIEERVVKGLVLRCFMGLCAQGGQEEEGFNEVFSVSRCCLRVYVLREGVTWLGKGLGLHSEARIPLCVLCYPEPCMQLLVWLEGGEGWGRSCFVLSCHLMERQTRASIVWACWC